MLVKPLTSESPYPALDFTEFDTQGFLLLCQPRNIIEVSCHPMVIFYLVHNVHLLVLNRRKSVCIRWLIIISEFLNTDSELAYVNDLALYDINGVFIHSLVISMLFISSNQSKRRQSDADCSDRREHDPERNEYSHNSFMCFHNIHLMHTVLRSGRL